MSSVGVVRGKRLLPGTAGGMEHACYFRHALALDERRVKFLPEYAYGGDALPRESLKDNPRQGNGGSEPMSGAADHSQGQRNGLRNMGNESSRQGRYAHTKEVWFAGTHSDM